MSDEELTRLANAIETQNRREAERELKLVPVKPMRVLRALFGHDVEAPGDRIELDGAEEASGRIGFSLIGKDGETKRCGITPAYTTVIEAPDLDPDPPRLKEHKGIDGIRKELRTGFDDDGATWLDMIVVDFHYDMAKACSEGGQEEQLLFIIQYLGGEDAATKWLKERLDNDG